MFSVQFDCDPQDDDVQGSADGAAAAVAGGCDDDKVTPDRKRVKPKRGRDKLPRKRERTGQLTLEFNKRPPKVPSTPPDSEPGDGSRRASEGSVAAARHEDLLAVVPKSIDELPQYSDALRNPGTRRLFHMVVTHRWIPSLSGKPAVPMHELAGRWHMRHCYQDDAMLEADLCRELHTRSDHTRSHEDYTTFLAVLTRCIGRLRREIRDVGEGSAKMISDSALVTAFGLATPEVSEAYKVGLFGEPIWPRHDYFDGHLKAYFGSDHFTHIRNIALDLARREKAKSKNPGAKLPTSPFSIIFLKFMTMYASYYIMPPDFEPFGPHLVIVQDLDARQDQVAIPTDDIWFPPDDSDQVGSVRLLHLFRCIRLVCRKVSQAKVERPRVDTGASLFVSVGSYLEVIQHRLLNLPRADPAIEIYRLGALVFAYGAIAFVKATDALLILVENLVVALKAPRYTDGQPPQLLFWAAMLGAIASAPQSGIVLDSADKVTMDCLRMARYLVGEVRRLARVLGLGSWEEAQVVLQGFVWAPSACDAGARTIWDVSQAESEQQQLKILQVVPRLTSLTDL
ncbi:hypothetical protein PGQ11_011037 [Apiospora arundinis]|uniref:Uncharacterized protein n=1 Tax=Apiospora arundinis TaxID=335852 RepID=A0ABR2HZH6_9PEZI